MKTYLSFFKMRFINELQYRAAAYASVATQFAWGFMTILMFNAFYKSNPENFPMSFEQLTTYIWLQQALLALFMAWFFDNDIFDSITSGNVAYELCRPAGIFEMWFVKSIASRVSKVVLRCAPILLVAAVLPKPFGISLPPDLVAFIMFAISIILGSLIMVSINMLIYISAFYTVSSMGIRILAVSMIELFAGAIIPIPFLPKTLQNIFNLLPFASTQNTPFLIYNGFYGGNEAIYFIGLQLAWLTCSVIIGKLMMQNALKKVMVQGG